MRFLSVRPDCCRRLPSDSTSRWTPLPLGLSPFRTCPCWAYMHDALPLRSERASFFCLRGTLTKNPAILYQGVPLFGCFEGFPTHLDKKTAISLLRSTKPIESRGRHSTFHGRNGHMFAFRRVVPSWSRGHFSAFCFPDMSLVLPQIMFATVFCPSRIGIVVCKGPFFQRTARRLHQFLRIGS